MAAPIHAKVVIIGSGPAGYTAAIYAARAMLEPVLDQGIQPAAAHHHHRRRNYPGFADVIQGPWLMEPDGKAGGACRHQDRHRSRQQARVEPAPFRITTDSGDVYLADAVILSTGAQARWLGIPSEEKFKGFGVSACATCRRLLLPQQGGVRGWRRQHRRRGSTVPHQLRLACHAGSSPRQPARPSVSCRTACSSIPRSV